MTKPERCGRCGAELEGGTPGGLCPRCLLEAGIEASAATSAESERTTFPSPAQGTGPLEADAALKSPGELARLFPQLEIQELLGHGGMGAVYLARQKALDRLVALKLLAPRGGSSPEFAERFTREARALARLNHPRIVAVYDFGIVEGLSFFLMEYVDGTNLRHLMRNGHLSPREALALIPQICDALQYAHDEGVVHRDIKPENILLDKKGRVKIADFGLAKILGTDQSEAGLTGSRHVMGTPHYMAPEQLEHPKEVDHRADIYSLGVVFYEMLTGELPLGRFAPPSKKVRVDVRLDEVVLRALEKEPERRYQHASDVKTDVEKIEITAAPDAAENGEDWDRGPRSWSSEEALDRARSGLWWLGALDVVFVFLAFRTGNTAFLCFVPVTVDALLSGFFRCLAPGEARFLRSKDAKRRAFLWSLLTVLVVQDVLPVFKASSFIWSGLFAAALALTVLSEGFRTLSAKSPEERTRSLLLLQSFAMALLVFPAHKPMDYLAWVYRLSDGRPEPNDVLVLRALFTLTLLALFAWKVRTWMAWSKTARLQGPDRRGPAGSSSQSES